MIGTEGGEELCDCTVDRIAQSYPDAADQWEAYALEVTERLDRRGVLGMVADSVWLNSRGEEIAEFAAAQGEALSQCSQELLNRTMGGIE